MSAKVLFVCLGNICRSPVAMAKFQHFAKSDTKANSIIADSAATSSWEVGNRPDGRALRNALKHGLAFTHKARQIQKEDFYNFDLILAMDKSIFSEVLQLSPYDSPAEIRLFREFDPIPGDLNVKDPYYGEEEGFEEVYQIIDRTVPYIADYLLNKEK